MIDPHGGSLVNRVLEPEAALELEGRAGSMRRVVLGARESSDLRMISIGAFSPLTGFLKSDDYASVVADSRLTTGEVWTIPITLSLEADDAAGIRQGDDLALYGTDGNLLGAMTAEDIFSYDSRLEAREVFRTEDEEHPGVANLYAQGDVLVGGPIWALPRRPLEVYADADRPPSESRALYESNGWRTVVGFQTRNPIHRAHEYIMKCALELVDGLVVHPLTGETKAGDTDAAVRMRCYRELLSRYYPSGRTVLSTFPAFMRYGGPREAVFHAICRKNYGCTHFIVGRDHAGVGNYYGTYDAQHIFSEFDPSDLGIQPMFFEHSFFCRLCGNMATSKTCPHDSKYHVFLSGTKVREMLERGERPPEEFTRPEVADILIAAARA